MKTAAIEEELNYDIEAVWAIFADVTRADWVPAVDSITQSEGVRSFTMEGIGEVREKILRLDNEQHCLQYTAIETPTPLEHHLATIQLSASENGCHFSWITEIAPDQFLPAIEQGMKISFAGLKEVLAQSAT